MTKEMRKERPKRPSLTNQGPLAVSSKKPGREYRFVTDKDGRVERKIALGWVVESAADHQVGYRSVDKASEVGAAARYPVGQGEHSVLMSIDKDWYDEDQADKQRQVDESEQTIKHNAINSHKGKFEVSRGGTGD